MPSWGTKHRPQSQTPDSLSAAAAAASGASALPRPAPFPQKSTAGLNAESNVVLGMHEPNDGRYQTLSRATYTPTPFPAEYGQETGGYGEPQPNGGSSSNSASATPLPRQHQPFSALAPKPHALIVREKHERESRMHNKTFLLSEVERMPHGVYPAKSDKITAVNPSTAVGPHDRQQQLLEVKGMATAMASTSLFISERDKTSWKTSTTSTNKDAFAPPSSSATGHSSSSSSSSSPAPHDVHHHRLVRMQQGTSNIPLVDAPPAGSTGRTSACGWQSQAQSAYTNTPALQANSKEAAVERHRMASNAQCSAVSIGSLQSNRKDELQTLKQLDYTGQQQRAGWKGTVAAGGDSRAAAAVQHGLVLGYQGRDAEQSLYQASFTPTVFV